MIIYSVCPPIFSDDITVSEIFLRCGDGTPSFYEKDPSGKDFLKFSTDPKKYLEDMSLL